jgi:hypothetical protein
MAGDSWQLEGEQLAQDTASQDTPVWRHVLQPGHVQFPPFSSLST